MRLLIEGIYETINTEPYYGSQFSNRTSKKKGNTISPIHKNVQRRSPRISKINKSKYIESFISNVTSIIQPLSTFTNVVDLSPYLGHGGNRHIDTHKNVKNLYIIKDTTWRFLDDKTIKKLNGCLIVLSPPRETRNKFTHMMYDKITQEMQPVYYDKKPKVYYSWGPRLADGQSTTVIHWDSTLGIDDLTPTHEYGGIDDMLCAYISKRLNLTLITLDVDLGRRTSDYAKEGDNLFGLLINSYLTIFTTDYGDDKLTFIETIEPSLDDIKTPLFTSPSSSSSGFDLNDIKEIF